MNDDLIYSIFKELAVVEGKRKPDGSWTDATQADVSRLLSRSFAIVRRAGTAVEKDA